MGASRIKFSPAIIMLYPIIAVPSAPPHSAAAIAPAVAPMDMKDSTIIARAEPISEIVRQPSKNAKNTPKIMRPAPAFFLTCVAAGCAIAAGCCAGATNSFCGVSFAGGEAARWVRAR